MEDTNRNATENGLDAEEIAKNIENINFAETNNRQDKQTSDYEKFRRNRSLNTFDCGSTEDIAASAYREKCYIERLDYLRSQLTNLNVDDIQIEPEDMVDKFCDAEKPTKISFNDISAAAYRIKGGVEISPCTRSHLSSLTGMEIFLKKDFLQYTGSFKERGARNALLNLPKSQKSNGVIAASAGNHALALCYHGKMLKIPVVVVMPNYDHPHILAGQGTMALEIIEQVPDVDAIVVPTGGGGLLAGICVAAKSMNPDIQIICAESERCSSFYNSYINGKPVFTKAESTLADGLAVPLVGFNSFATAAPLIDKCVTVSEEYIAIAILRLLELEKAVVEGAGACGLAAILQGLLPELKNKKVVIPICGGNIDTSILGRVLERALVADSRLIKMWVTISDRPGSLAEFCKLVSTKGASIKDLNHERAWLKKDIFSVQVQAILEVSDSDNAREVEEAIREKYREVVMGPYGV